jgi:DNA repair protein RecO (recombination protein O)
MAGSGRLLETPALVVASMRFKEADRILTLYTRERGRLSAIARGVRRTRSKLGGRLEPFSLVRVELYPGRSMYTVTGADTIRSFHTMRDALFRMEQGARLLESVRRLFPEEEQNRPAFNLLVRAVGALATSTDADEAALVVLAARLKLLLALGYLPALDTCSLCGESTYLCGFNPSLGGVVCTQCFGEEAHDCFSLSAEALAAMHALLEMPLSQAPGVGLGAPARREVETTIVRVLAHHGH